MFGVPFDSLIASFTAPLVAALLSTWIRAFTKPHRSPLWDVGNDLLVQAFITAGAFSYATRLRLETVQEVCRGADWACPELSPLLTFLWREQWVYISCGSLCAISMLYSSLWVKHSNSRSGPTFRLLTGTVALGLVIFAVCLP